MKKQSTTERSSKEQSSKSGPSNFESIEDVLEDQLKDLFSAESQLIKALPKMSAKASNAELKQAIEDHLEETKTQLERLQTIESMLEIKLKGKVCKAMEGLIEEGKEALEAKGEDAFIDLLIVGAAQRVEHYEMAAYGTARALAEQLGETEIVDLLQETLDEEKAADEKLTEVTQSELFSEEMSKGGSEERHASR